MFVKDYISKDYPAFRQNTEVAEAQEIAVEFGYSHVFIQKKGSFVGALSREFLEENPEGTIAEQDLHFERFAMMEDANILDSIKLFHTFNSNVVPIIDKSEKYLGYISCDDVFGEFSKYPLFSETGAVFTVQTSGRHYTFTEIAKIVEGNNAKIYGCYISSATEDAVQITLKISSENLSSVNETFERYGYTIVQKHYSDEKDELMKDRYGFFQKFLEV